MLHRRCRNTKPIANHLSDLNIKSVPSELKFIGLFLKMIVEAITYQMEKICDFSKNNYLVGYSAPFEGDIIWWIKKHLYTSRTPEAIPYITSSTRDGAFVSQKEFNNLKMVLIKSNDTKLFDGDLIMNWYRKQKKRFSYQLILSPSMANNDYWISVVTFILNGC